MDIKLGFKLVKTLFRLSEELHNYAIRLNIRLSMKAYYRENGHL